MCVDCCVGPLAARELFLHGTYECGGYDAAINGRNSKGVQPN
jgi:hypothetical protein